MPETDDKALQLNHIEDLAIRTAISFRLQGYTWASVAQMLADRDIKGPRGGAFDPADVYKRCQPYLKMIQQSEGFKSLKAATLDVAMEAVAQVGDALVKHEIPKQSLPVVMGISVDKYARLEAIEREPEKPSNPILEMLAKINANGGTLKLEVTQPKTLDVEIVEG